MMQAPPPLPQRQAPTSSLNSVGIPDDIPRTHFARIGHESSQHIDLLHLPHQNTFHVTINYDKIPVFSSNVLNLTLHAQSVLKSILPDTPSYIFFRSSNHKSFGLGGDLSFFMKCILDRDYESLSNYAFLAILVLKNQLDLIKLGHKTISIVNASAIGGGMEFAVSCQYIISHRSAKFQLPEVQFGIFPGMGAYSILLRRISYNIGLDIIRSGRSYSSMDLASFGLISHIYDSYVDLENMIAHSFYSKFRKLNNSKFAFAISWYELLSIVRKWVDCVMKIDDRALERMERYAKIQQYISTNRYN